MVRLRRGGALRVRATLFFAALAVACERASEAPPPAPAPVVPERPPLPAGRAVPDGDPETLALLDRYLVAPISRSACGPYSLRTDLVGIALDAGVAVCETIAAGHERELETRFGLRPAPPPAGTIFFFASRRRFRESLAAQGDLPPGYAGWSDARRGVIALAAEGIDRDELARTLAHELTHLALRRLFGFPRPRWLEEGMADAVSDSASASGFVPLAGWSGAEAARRRWLDRPPSPSPDPGAGGPLERLVGLDWDQFDAGAASRDYELAALFVRFLLLDRELSPRFRGWLAGQTAQTRSPPGLTEALATGWPSLERRFEAWVRGSS